MLFQIKHRWTGVVLFERESGSLRLAVEAAVLNKTDLYGADLGGADLGGADLRGAHLGGSDLGGADLRNAHLEGINLQGADLWGINLGGADLCNARLWGVHLGGADLRNADLRGVHLGGADLRGADLRGAHLGGSDLGGADLRGAHLLGAHLLNAQNAELIQARASIVPEQGAFEGWKLCRDHRLVRLLIPAEARRSSATGRKCRAECVEVLEIIGGEEAVSLYDGVTIYRVGERIACDQWTEDRWQDCGGGIHFYLTRIEAENHE